MTIRFNLREIIVLSLIFLLAFAFIGRAFYIQVYKQEFHEQEAEKRHVRSFDIPAKRGAFFDRHGNLLALSTPMASIAIDPKVILDLEDKYRQLLTVINMSDAEFNQTLQSQRFKNLSFIDYLSDEQKQQILDLDLEGVFVRTDSVTYHRDNRVIIVDGSKPALWANKSLLDRYRYTLSRVAQQIEWSERKLRKKVLSRPNSRFMYLKRLVRTSLADGLQQARLYGVYIEKEYRRFYPAGETVGNLIGFTDIDDTGIEGLERTFDSHLKGSNGSKKVLKSRDGMVIDFVSETKPVEDGKPVKLSIDQHIQYFTYKALKATMKKHQANSASAAVLDAKTGEILAMASLPGFNPNDISQRHGRAIRNRVVADLIEPGSTIKPFTIAKALDEEIIQVDSVIKTGNGYFRLGKANIKDSKGYGDLTPDQIVQKSSNVGTAKIAIQFDPQTQYDYWDQLGFAIESGNYLPGEAIGNIKSRREWEDPVIRATAAYGYGFNTNVLALARAYTLFSNDGHVLPVSIFKLDEQKPPQGVPVLSKRAAQQTLDMMRAVVKKGGTATQARIEGYSVAGKTGTVHKVSNQGGYQENTYVALFAGMVPASNPDMIMVVAVNEPSRGVYYGGQVAAPVFKSVMQNALRLRGVRPDEGLE